MEENMMRASKPILAVAGLALSLAGSGAGSALAQTSTAAESTKPKVADKSASRRVCRNIVQSGTRLSSRVCQTAGEWEKAMLDTQNAALEQQTGAGYRDGPEAATASVPR
jgi:hypothetical protein